jgi:hypothetical protein
MVSATSNLVVMSGTTDTIADVVVGTKIIFQ